MRTKIITLINAFCTKWLLYFTCHLCYQSSTILMRSKHKIQNWINYGSVGAILNNCIVINLQEIYCVK